MWALSCRKRDTVTIFFVTFLFLLTILFLGPSGFSQRTPWNFKWYPREGQVYTSVRPPAKCKIAVCSAAFIGELGFFLAIELQK